MKPRLFGSSGIRGLANVEITTTLAQRVGAALATIHEGGSMVVGRDPRLTGPMLESALLSGLAAGGADALALGLVPTPVTAWMIRETGSDAGVEITASHNPPQYNGLKVFNGDGMSFTNREQLRLNFSVVSLKGNFSCIMLSSFISINPKIIWSMYNIKPTLTI